MPDPATPGSASWWTAREAAASRRRPRAEGLSLDAVLDAAMAIVDTDGLDALTMRRLAGDLGCAHTSLYRHVASRREIEVLLVDRVIGMVPTPQVAPGGEPRDPVASAADALRAYRAVLLAHRSLAPAFLDGQMLGPNAIDRREASLTQVLAAGASPALAARAYLSLTHFVISSVVFESSGAARSRAERDAMRSHFERLDAQRFPVLVAMAGTLNDVDGAEEFEFGLAALLESVERAIAAEAARTSDEITVPTTAEPAGTARTGMRA